MTEFKYKPDGDVLKAFMKDDTFFRGIRGPVGSGKSVGCCVEVFRRALMQKKNDKGIGFIKSVEAYANTHYTVSRKQMEALNKIYKRVSENLFEGDENETKKNSG